MSALSDLNDLDLDINNIGNWPLVAKIIVVTLLCAILIGGVIYFDTNDQQADLEKVQKKEEVLKQRLMIKAAKAAIIDQLKAQLEEMRTDFKKLSRQLPNRTEVPELLVDISQTGLASGLEFELFKPSRESQKDFYAELPIKIKVTGTYHEFGTFASGIAALPRIVTLHNINLSRKGKGNKMVMTATAKTYRSLIDDEGKK
ncbi:MAG: type 4a pilus biogenesis protein PilO [Gammaproteobacteria bacterium]|nr:type 4a pilus biogenesis protein PilO [Gammaproteobacteria bacterium]